MTTQILTYWLVAQLVGLAGLPLAAFLLRALPDRGYAFAKTLGLLLTGYLAWLAAMLGLAPFEAPILVIAALAVAALGVWALGGPGAVRQAWRPALAARWRGILASEAVFLAAFLAAVWMRSHEPTPWGTERPMDFAFFNAVQRSGTFPPADPWLAGFSINYYYFGYVLMGAMARLSGLDPAAAYNLALALIFALTAQGVAGLIANLMALVSRTAAGDEGAQARPSRSAYAIFPLLGVVFVLVAANQSGAVQLALGDERAVALSGPQLLSALGQAAGGATTIRLAEPVVTGDFGTFDSWERRDTAVSFNWWWPSRSLWDAHPVDDPSRPGVTAEQRYNITEFPLFSFRLGDMHPHVMALPFGLLAAALACATLARGDLPPLAQSRRGWLELALTGVVLGGLYALNSWDLPTYMLLYGAALALLVLRLDEERPWLELGRLLALVVAASYLLFLPFHLTFRSLVGSAEPWIDFPVLGRISSIIAPYTAGRSGLHAFVIIFGLFAVPIVAFIYLTLQGAAAGARRDTGATGAADAQAEERAADESASGWVRSSQSLGVADGPALPLSHAPTLPWLPWLPLALLIVGPLIGFPLLFLAGLGALALERAWRLRARPGESFALLLGALGCAVLFGTELIFIRDLFGNRMNTIFKFYYQVWLLWGALAPFALWWALRHARGGARIASLGAAALTVALLWGALIYPWLSLGELARGEPQDLQGRTPRQWTAAGEASIDWLRRQAPAGSVVLEAAALDNAAEAALGSPPRCGGSYNGEGYGGVSSATGLPTVLGWYWHQVQWRGGDPEANAQLAPRCADVDAIYRGADPGQARELLAKYGVDFVYVGGLERGLYPADSLAKFAQLGEVAFQQDEVTIYRLR
jgi:YYY domain-containing protein